MIPSSSRNRSAGFVRLGTVPLIGIACFFFNATLAADSSGEAMILWMNFDDGTANDLSGNGLDGELAGGAEVVSDPERGMVLSLNGDGGHVPIRDPDGLLDFSDGRSATVAAWIRPGVSKNHNQVFAQGAWNVGPGLGVKGDTSPADQLWSQGQGTGASHLSDAAVPIDRWSHVAVAFDYDAEADTLEVAFFLNGERTGFVEGGSLLPGGLSAPGRAGSAIGREQREADDALARWFFDGLIDDFLIYEKALDQSQVMAVMEGIPVAAGTLIELSEASRTEAAGKPGA